MGNPVYLDNHATTPLDPRVLEAMLPFFREKFGNAASRSHRYGWEAEKAVEKARRQIADLAGARPREIVFTSGATESDNLAIKGALEAAASGGDHIVTMATEHKAVLDTCRHVVRLGRRVTVLPPRPDGLLDLDSLRDALLPETVLVSVMHANNEIGTVQPIDEIAAICRERCVLFHCDAAQSFGKIPVNAAGEGPELISITAHKMYGPKGIGALFVRSCDPRAAIAAQIDGGGHERGMRSGTLNVPAIVGFGQACAIAGAGMAEEGARVAQLRDRLKAGIEAGLTGVRTNGSMEHRLPGNLNLSFAGVDGESLLTALHDVALSSGSACSSATVEPSHVLKALGLTDPLARSSIRFGVGRFNTADEIEFVVGRVLESVRRLRDLTPV